MKQIIDLTGLVVPEIRLYQGVDYTLVNDEPIILSTLQDAQRYYPRCAGNGTSEVFVQVTPETMTDQVWVITNGVSIKVRFEYTDWTLRIALEDAIPGFISDEYPLFKKLLEYYFLYLGQEFKPSDFVHNMDKYAHIDQTFDELRQNIYDEVLSELPDDTAASKVILAKYILQFYSQRGTEDSIRFLFRVLYDEDIKIERGRDFVLIASDDVQGRISDPRNVLQDNSFYQLFGYAILSGQPYSRYKDILYKLVNPTGYLPFGARIRSYPED